MKRLFLILGIFFCAAHAHATTCPIAAGASQTTISGTITSCGSGNTATFAAGSYSMNASVTIPCGVNISGPTVAIAQYTGDDGYKRQGYTPTAKITWTGAALTPMFQLPTCNTAAVFQYMECNMGQPAPDGGQCIHATTSGGVNKLTIQYNFLHGNQGNTANANHFGDELILFDGGTGSTYDDSDVVQWNRFGASGDCSNVNTSYSYSGWSGNGGFCSGLAEHTNMSNFTSQYNDFQDEENNAKFYEGSGGCINCVWQYSDYSKWHRIAMENQSNSGASFPTNQEWQYNSVHDALNPGVPTFGWSIANGCFNGATPPNPSNCISDADSNVILANAPLASGQSRYADAIEWFGSRSHVNYNLLEGYANSIMIGVDGSLSANNNAIYNTNGGTCTVGNSSGGYFNIEEGPEALALASGTGNSCNSSSNSAVFTSVAPTVTPASLSFTGTQAWTVTNPGANRDANTNAWCTTDGSTPVPGSNGTFYASGTGGTVSATTTVKCVGMWGSANQPASYQSGWGYVPSAVISQTYTANSGYYISPSGSDSNAGTSGSPWASPNHSVPCGTTITAQTGTYSATNFQSGKWGAVTGCGSGNAANVAWVTCATFDACQISTSGQSAVQIGAPYWGISGFEATTTTPGYACFNVQPTGTTSIHHVIFANDVCNSAFGGGFQATQGSSGPTVDYINFIGNIAYNAAQGSDACHSGLTLGFIKQLDANAGTHILVAGNYAWDNFDPATCASHAPTDGEGMELDTLDQYTYSGQVLIENNIFVGNGGRGLNVNNNNGSPYATVYLKNNTAYGNNQQTGQEFPTALGEIEMTNVNGVTASNNIAMTSTGSIGGNAIYAYAWNPVGTANSVAGNWLYSAAGNTTFGSGYGTNVTGTSPAFASTTIPGAPSCSGTANVPACAATLIANFTPTTSGSTTYGYQAPTGTSVTDPLYPAWLCNVTLPAGLINPGCGGSPTPTLVSGYQGNTGSLASIAIGATAIQQNAIGTFSDGSTHTLPYGGYTGTWSSSNPTDLGVSTTGLITGLVAGTANSQVTSNPGSIVFSPWTWTVTGTTPIPSGGYLSNSGSVNTANFGGGTIPFTASIYYSNISGTNTLPDAYGNTATWSIVAGSGPTCGTVNSSGVFTPASSGPTTTSVCNVKATCSCSATINQWTMTVTPSSATPAPPEITVIIVGP